MSIRWSTILPPLIITMLAWWLGQLPPIADFNRTLNDWAVTRIAAASQPDPDIVVVDIDDASLHDLAPVLGQWPWPRSAHAYLVEGLHKAGAATVIFDLLLSEPDVYRPESDAFLEETLNTHAPNFLAALWLGEHSPIPPRNLKDIPASLLVEPTNATGPVHLLLPAVGDPEKNPPGLINFSGDDDGVLRQYRLWYEENGVRLASLPFQVLRFLNMDTPKEPVYRIKYKGTSAFPYTTFSYADLLNRIMTGKPLPDLDDAWVIIGTSASGLHDLRSTPIQPLQPAVYLLATVLDNLRHHERLSGLDGRTAFLIAGMLTLLATLLGGGGFRGRLLRQVGYHLLLWSLALLYVLWSLSHDWLPDVAHLLAPPFMATLLVVLMAGYEEAVRRRKVVQLFGRFLDPRVVRSLLQARDEKRLMQPQQCTITVLFSDIRGFTTLSEKSSPDEVVALLNAYFARQVDVIFAHGGTLDKFIGDAIMAFWGAPIAQHDQADRALAAAVEMQKVKDEFVASLPPHLRHFDVGIGLHTGPAVVGMVGSDRRVDYTAIGDTVNLASRIEGLTKSLAPLLFSDATRAALTGQWACRSVGSTQVKGREKPVSLFTLSGDGAIPDIPAMKHEEG